MFKEIIELGRRLEASDKLPPPGFYYYGQPIKWVVHLWLEDSSKIHLENSEIDKPRPFCGRTSGIEAHPCVDEAGYVFGITKEKGGGSDQKAKDKHNAFLLLLKKICDSTAIKDESFRLAIKQLDSIIRSGAISKLNGFNRILNKDWVSFVFNEPVSDFHVDEFVGSLTVENLCKAIGMDNYELSIKQPNNSIYWLNDLLKVADIYLQITKKKNSQTPSKYLIKLKDEYDKSKDEKVLKRLNRYLLEEFYSRETPKTDKHLYEHPEIKKFWQEELKDRTRQDTDAGKAKTGICSICGQSLQMAKKIPVGVKLYKPNPLHSYNIDSFVSYITGTQVFKKAHLGQCVICGDTIARTLNYLTDNELHYKIIAQDRKDGKLNTDSARNQFALFWLKDEQPMKVGETTINPSELLKNIGSIMDRADKNVLPPDLMQLGNMLNVPWTGRDASVNIADNAFYLLVLSPNKGRIAVRDWIHISLDKLQQNLKTFLDSQRIVDPAGVEIRCFGIPEILKAVEASNISKPPYKAVEISNPNVSRQLLRTAYLGEPPPSVLFEAAVLCMRNMKIFEKPNTQHILMATLKMYLTHKKEGVKEMETLDVNRNTVGYLCGRLLSILEEAQLRAARWKINTTLVERFYGSASSAPVSVFGTLVKRATTDHFPKIRKQQLGYKDLEALMESVQSDIDQAGGFPKTLSLAGQAEFSLGFYHQRAKFSAKRANKK